ncbi:cytosolic Fe-S cluster assembly factor NARFL [Perkinsela sp. CCAP 1560/4]|nr:cytosolic Fe-S cluster assembly factor NARFL [Perkinsela sp. CCAP 1560/4]|eukprot:KNH07084.1 cytosolic Fe-S cluster assembly factor NARFL [Perkinsela sp. CCAP 1560/4]
MPYSNTVRLENSSDYINPSNACIISLSTEILPQETTSDRSNIKIKAHKERYSKMAEDQQSEIVRKPNEQESVEAEGSSKRIQVSLADCLACSGCVTSAEEVLIQQHGTANLNRTLTNLLSSTVPNEKELSKKKLVATIAPQVIADLCVHYGDTNTLVTFSKIFHFLTKSVGFHYVLSTEFAESVSSDMVCAEYLERINENHSSKNAMPLPLLTSACPGFVCFIEKQHPLLLPHLSRVMSQQSITGVIIDSLFGDSVQDSAQSEMYLHVSIQPCYDRKLEASRERNALHTHFVISTIELLDWMEEMNFVPPNYEDAPHNTESIDSTTSQKTYSSEIDKITDLRRLNNAPNWIIIQADLPHPLVSTMMLDESQKGALSDCIDGFLSCTKPGRNQLNLPATYAGEADCSISERMDGSGGYHKDVLLSQWLMHAFISDLRPISNAETKSHCHASIHYRTRRNSNHQEVYILDNSSSDPNPPSNEQLQRLKQSQKFVTIMYGFQHIQNLTRSLNKALSKPDSTENKFIENYSDFIEVMACPGGCLNGSAQSRRKRHSLHDGQNHLRAVERRFYEWKSICASDRSSIGVDRTGQKLIPKTVVLSLASLLANIQTQSHGTGQHEKQTSLNPYAQFFTSYSPPSDTRDTHEKNYLTVNDVAW